MGGIRTKGFKKIITGHLFRATGAGGLLRFNKPPLVGAGLPANGSSLKWPTSDKHCGCDVKAFRQGADLAYVQIPLSGEYLGDHALAAQLRQIGLPQSVLLHQQAQHFACVGCRCRVVRLFVGMHQRAQGIQQLIQRMSVASLFKLKHKNKSVPFLFCAGGVR